MIKEEEILEDIYIDNTVSIWGGKNGEVCFELEDGRTITFNAYNFMRDLPAIVELTFAEVAAEKRHIQNRYKELAKFITK